MAIKILTCLFALMVCSKAQEDIHELKRLFDIKCKQIDENTRLVKKIIANCDCAGGGTGPLVSLPIDCKDDLGKCGLTFETKGRGKASFGPNNAYVQLSWPTRAKNSDFAAVWTPPINVTGSGICIRAFAQVVSPSTGTANLNIFGTKSVPVTLSRKSATDPQKVFVPLNGGGSGGCGSPSFVATAARASKKAQTIIRFTRFLITSGSDCQLPQ